jgi:hypothetical protein
VFRQAGAQEAHPTTTGKVERFHRTLRKEFLTGRTFDDLPTAQAELAFPYRTACQASE